MCCLSRMRKQHGCQITPRRLGAALSDHVRATVARGLKISAGSQISFRVFISFVSGLFMAWL